MKYWNGKLEIAWFPDVISWFDVLWFILATYILVDWLLV